MARIYEHITARLGADLIVGEEMATNGKTSVSSGTYQGSPIIIKTIVTDDAFYNGSFQKELVVYRHLEATPPPFTYAKPVLLESDPGIIVMRRLPGAPLSEDRFPSASELPLLDVDQICALLDCVRQYRGFPLDSRDSVLVRYNERWTKYVGHGLYHDDDRAILTKLERTNGWQPEFNHGDVIPANILRQENHFGLIDWEFAGPFVPGYDLATLWAVLSRHPRAQAHIVDRALNTSEPERLCFAANTLNVASREVRIHLDLPDGHPIKAPRLEFLMPLMDQARSIIKAVI